MKNLNKLLILIVLVLYLLSIADTQQRGGTNKKKNKGNRGKPTFTIKKHKKTSDEEDQKRLLMMTEKEREQELFNRSEKREVLKTRFEIEKKLRLAKKKEQNKIPFTDTTLRSTDRRKALENNRKQKDGLKQLKGNLICLISSFSSCPMTNLIY